MMISAAAGNIPWPSTRMVRNHSRIGTEFGALEYNQLCAAIQGFVSCTTQFSADRKTVTETDANGRKRITVFGKDENGNRLITETLKEANDAVIGSKTTTFTNGNSTITEEVQV